MRLWQHVCISSVGADWGFVGFPNFREYPGEGELNTNRVRISLASLEYISN